MSEPDHLARFARLSQASHRRDTARRALERWEELKREAVEAAESERRGRESPEFLAGPPDGCHVCYTWRKHFKWHDWGWSHGAALNPALRIVRDDEPGSDEAYMCIHCTCSCHGPAGLPLPTVVLA